MASNYNRNRRVIRFQMTSQERSAQRYENENLPLLLLGVDWKGRNPGKNPHAKRRL